MKNVLILAYDYPPYVSVGGLRPHYWFENFHKYDIYPIVVTRNWNPIHGNPLDYLEESSDDKVVIEILEQGTLIKTPYNPTISNRLNLKGKRDFISNIVKKLNTGFYELFQWYLPIGTKYQLYKAAVEYLKNNKVDVIIATGEPFILFKYASELSRKFNIPWIADYRDPWSNNFGRKHQKFNLIQEKKYVESANKIITPTEHFIYLINKIIPTKKIELIRNGFSGKILEPKFNENNELVKIVFLGTIYNWHPWKKIINSINELNLSTKKFELHFIGMNVEEEVRAYIKQNDFITESFIFHPKTDNSKIDKFLFEADLLLLFNDFKIIGTKIFDYLRAKRNILFCFTDESQESRPQQEIIKKTNSGYLIKDENHLKEFLNEFLEKESLRICNSIYIEEFSREIQTEKLADLIKSI